MKKALIIANMLFASATVFGMENPATELDLNSRSYYSQREDILRSKHIESFDELIGDWSETNQRCFQLRQELNDSGELSEDQRRLAENHLNTNARILGELNKIIEEYSVNSVINSEGDPLLIRAIDNVNLAKRILNPHIEQINMDNSLFFLFAYGNKTEMSNEQINEYLEDSASRSASKYAKIAKNRYGTSALFFALYNRNLGIANRLLRAGSNVNERFGEESYLSYFLKNRESSQNPDRNEIVYWLIGNGADINERVDNSEHFLHIAVKNRDLDLVKYLVEHGANIDAPNEFGQSPLFLAILSQYYEVAQRLVNYGAAIKDQQEGWGPMFVVKKMAETSNSPTLLQLIWMMNWSKELQDFEEGMTAYDNAWIDESLKMS
ncbi:MAG: ankyrin repeat domain-containing protein [Alphaproteobacteria bacterium]|nr:ankyrin repeat domain-containing protein [Alphaproteobacteria bacterium]